MPIQIKKSSGDDAMAPVEGRRKAVEQTHRPSGEFDPKNRSPRSLVGWSADMSPSVAEEHANERDHIESALETLRKHPVAGRSVMFDLVQILDTPISTGFADIARFTLPAFQAGNSTPIHTTIELARSDFEQAVARLRSQGLDRTESVWVFTSDGFANGCSVEELDAAVTRFRQTAKKLSVTPIIVGVGQHLNLPFLKSLVMSVPVLQLKEFRADILLPFIQKVAVSASMSRRGDAIEVELPSGLEPIE